MSQIAIISLLTLLCCMLALAYPFAIYPLILRMLPVRAVSDGGMRPASATLVFCAFNEGRAMPEKIANLDRLKRLHPALQILAFDDGSSDDTAAQLAARADLLTLVRGGGRSGKAHGMKLLAAQARGEVIIFTDANVTLAPEAIDNLLRYYADPLVGGVLGSLHYLDEAGEGVTASVGSLYWRLEERLKDLESASGNVMGADGSIFSIRRALYPDFPDTVLDDLTVSMAVVFAGRRLIKARDVIAYERPVAERGDEYRRKVRISARAWHTHHYLRPQLRRMHRLDRFKYASRKVVRWFGGVFLVAGLLAALVLGWQIGGPVPFAGLAVLAGVGALAGLRAKSGPVAALAAILLAYLATLQGVFQAMRGRTFAVWNPAKSR
jgi:cellulose synthase/poly-beta-1,6-N-acetylglucosamine synthase-like glycosyltransferase